MAGLRRCDPQVLVLFSTSRFLATPLEPAFRCVREYAGLPCTGSGMLAIALANDKIRSRMLLRAAGIRVPRFIVLAPGASSALIDLTPPLNRQACMARQLVGNRTRQRGDDAGCRGSRGRGESGNDSMSRPWRTSSYRDVNYAPV